MVVLNWLYKQLRCGTQYLINGDLSREIEKINKTYNDDDPIIVCEKLASS